MDTIAYQEIDIIRAGLHAVPAACLAEEASFREGVTDVEIARLLLALERGARVVQSQQRTWHCPDKPYFLGRRRRHVIKEALRTGLAADHDGRLQPAPVHLADAVHHLVPACARWFVLSPVPSYLDCLRYRLTYRGALDLADCELCLDVPLSSVAYSTHD
jgi:hypothetical protein